MSKEFVIIPGSYYNNRYYTGEEIAKMWNVDFDKCLVISGEQSFKLAHKRSEKPLRNLVAQEDCSLPGWERYFIYTEGAWSPSALTKSIRERLEIPEEIHLESVNSSDAARTLVEQGYLKLTDDVARDGVIPWCNHTKAYMWLKLNDFIY